MAMRTLALAAFGVACASSHLVEDPAPIEEAAVASALQADDQCDADGQCALNALQLRSQRVLAAANSSVGGPGFGCASPLKLGPVSRSGNKGICLDDNTFELCSGEIPRYWPHTTEKVTSLRLFKPWGIAPPTVFHTDRSAAWANLKAFVKENGVQILLGTSVSCDEDADDREWELAKALMKDLGPSHFMGLAIGNELEILWMKSGQFQNPQCLDRLWNKKGYVKKFNERVADLDTIPGFGSLPVTAVFGMYATAGHPWVQEGKAGINDFLSAVWKTHGSRFVFSFNLYPYFDASNRCNPASIHSATSFNGGGQVPGSVKAVRSRMAAMGAGGARLWVAETGWSTPETNSVAATVKGCASFSSKETFKSFYSNFLSWDLAGADHVFYFTIHDSANFNQAEHFGLIDRCGSSACKL